MRPTAQKNPRGTKMVVMRVNREIVCPCFRIAVTVASAPPVDAIFSFRSTNYSHQAYVPNKGRVPHTRVLANFRSLSHIPSSLKALSRSSTIDFSVAIAADISSMRP